MTRRLQHRDISEPIERIVREHLDGLNIAAIHHGPLTRELISEVTDLVARAHDEAYHDGYRDAKNVFEDAR